MNRLRNMIKMKLYNTNCNIILQPNCSYIRATMQYIPKSTVIRTSRTLCHTLVIVNINK